MKVQLKNVGIIDKCDIEFIPGINLIVGSSGSGKSTLMRCLYNMATNDFSDSDISFGHNTMNIKLTLDDDIVEYTRSIKVKGDKCFYTVNDEQYTKLGRQPLQAVSDILKIGDININGEDVNFNFNLQFSTPFLILGSQSTLYNVLTYRSSFDISSINDYYSVDVKSNQADIATNEKLKEQLNINLSSLEEQEQSLSSIEQLYSDYISYKHKYEFKNELVSLNEKMERISKLETLANLSDTAIKNIENILIVINKLIELYKYKLALYNYDIINSKNNNCKSIICLYESAIHKLELLIDLKTIYNKLNNYNNIKEKYIIINNITKSIEPFIKNEEFTFDLVKQDKFLKKHNKYNNITKVLNTSNNNIINTIEDFICINDKLSSIKELNKLNKEIKRKCTLVHNKMSKFGVCPLCGSHLDIKEESIE